ncbi:hypothetical protein Ade02nite_27920 [Paractinoplanes deccanensis]|uniref:DUF4352 domain-containing protein n=1 Tax=Paractinoplanes deccanensis TaxID=113561 RepID=A0ABQ3Y2D1_9ACTN|nr:DUF4352 domain-containing protein [Actinoplanes deccanensis]GID74151.1 hypothetical protein Ade02nite_27920 [Actinoplanes deccanensis]
MIAPGYAPATSRWPRIIGGLVVLALVAAAGLLGYAKWRDRGGDEVLTTSGGQLNTPVPDGKLVFTVTAVRCRVASVGDGSVDLEPEGSFCLVDVVARNASPSALPFDSAAQKAYDGKGSAHENDMQAAVVVNPDRNFIYPIAAGNEARGTLVFDVPKGETLAAVELHESFDSTGARIALR